MKKLLISMLTVSAIAAPVAAVVSCAGGDEKIDVQPLYTGSKDEAILNKNLDGKTVGFVNYSGSDTFMQTVQAGIKNAGLGGTVKVSDATNDQGIENQRINTYLGENVNGLNINLVEPAAALNVINMAKKAGIPIVLTNKEAPADTRSQVMNSYSKVVYVGSDPFESGRMQAQLIYEDLKAGIIKDRDSDNKIDYVVLGGQKGHADAMARSQAVREKLYALIQKDGISPLSNQTDNVKVDADSKDFHVKKGLSLADVKNIFEDHSVEKGVATFVATTGEADWSVSGGKKVVESLLTKKVKLDFISGNNDDTALGGYSALKATAKPDLSSFGTSKPDAKWLPVYGIDANATAIASIKAGGLAGTVKQDGPGIGKASIAALTAMILGADIDSYFQKHNIAIKKDDDFANNRAYRVPYKAITRAEAKKL